MLRAFTRGSQEKNNSPILNFPMSIIIPRVTNILKTMSIKPPSSRRAGQVAPGGWSWSPHQAQGAGCTCVWPGGRVAEAGEDICSSSRSRVLGQSQSPPRNTFNAPGARGWGNENKTPDVHCQQPHRGRCWQLSTSYVLSSLSEHRGVEEEYVVCISQLARSALCFIRWELHRPRLISGLLLPLILHILGEQ